MLHLNLIILIQRRDVAKLFTGWWAGMVTFLIRLKNFITGAESSGTWVLCTVYVQALVLCFRHVLILFKINFINRFLHCTSKLAVLTALKRIDVFHRWFLLIHFINGVLQLSHIKTFNGWIDFESWLISSRITHHITLWISDEITIPGFTIGWRILAHNLVEVLVHILIKEFNSIIP